MDGLQVGDKIRQLRKEAGMTQADLAEKLNLNVASVKRWECNKFLPRLTVIKQISLIFKVPTSYFFPKEEHMKREELIGTCGGDGEFYFLFDEDGKAETAVVRVDGKDVWDCPAKAADIMLDKWKQIHKGEWSWEPDEAVRFYGFLRGYMKEGAE